MLSKDIQPREPRGETDGLHACNSADLGCASAGVPVVAALLSLAVTLPRVFRTLAVMGDSPELVTAAAVWGVPHAPGYPLYTLLGHGFSRLPFGETAFCVNLSSALFHAGAVAGVTDAVLCLTLSRTAALGAALVLMLSRSFLLGSLYAEVFPLNDMMFAWLLALGVRIADSSTGPNSSTGSNGLNSPAPSNRRLLAFSLAAGVASAHHMMIALAAPGLALLVGPASLRLARRAPRLVLGWVLGWALPIVLLYWLLLIAAASDPVVSWGDIHDWRSWLEVIARKDYGGLFSASARTVEGQTLERLDRFFEALARSFGFACVLGLTGAFCFFRGTRGDHDRPRRPSAEGRRIGAALVLLFLVSGPTFAAMNAFDIHSEYRAAFFERFVTMSHVAFAVLVGVGLHRVEAIRARGPLWAKLAIAISLLPSLFHWRHLDFRDEPMGIAYARDLVDVPSGALVLLAGDMPAHASLYACGIERRCEDRVVFGPGQLSMPWRVAQLARRYPALGLHKALSSHGTTEPQADAADRVESIMTAWLARGPVYVHPELVRRHPQLRERFTLVPELLLFRAYENGETLDRGLPELRARYEAIASGVSCRGCRTVPKSPVWHPSMLPQVVSAYTDGLTRQAKSAAVLGWHDVAARLRSMADALSQANER